MLDQQAHAAPCLGDALARKLSSVQALLARLLQLLLSMSSCCLRLWPLLLGLQLLWPLAPARAAWCSGSIRAAVVRFLMTSTSGLRRGLQHGDI